MTAWNIVSNSAGNVFKGEEVNNLYSNYHALAEQSSGAPHIRVPYMNTTSRDAWSGGFDAGKAAVIFNSTENQYQGWDPSISQWGEIGGGASFTVTWSGHTFTESLDVGKPITLQGSFQLADCSTPTLGDVCGVLAKVLDANRFKILQAGLQTLTTSQASNVVSGGLVSDTVYFLTASGATYRYDSVPPSTIGYVDIPVIRAISNLGIEVLNYRGSIVGGNTGHYSSSFVIGDVSSNVLTVAHGHGVRRVKVTLFDVNDSPWLPSTWIPTSGNETTSVDILVSNALLTEIGSNTWNVQVDI